MFLIPILNVLWRIVAGERYDYKDQKMKTLMQMLEKYMLETKLLQPNITRFLPFLAKMFPNLEGSVEGLKGEPGDIRHFLSETIQHHKDTLDANNIRDFIDAYLIEMKVIKNVGWYQSTSQTKINKIAKWPLTSVPPQSQGDIWHL